MPDREAPAAVPASVAVRRDVRLDMLRALAVALVFAAHLPTCPPSESRLLNLLTIPLVRGGWVGVDLFFALSGYLIAGLLFREYQRIGFLTAIDDFGAGFAGLNLLAEFQPDIIKLDMELVRHIDKHPARQAIARGVVRICDELGIRIIAEGIETIDECRFLQGLGVRLMQGYLFSQPLFEACGQAATLGWPPAPVRAT